MKAACGVPQQKQKQEENCSRIAPKRAAGSWAAAAVTSTSRARTTFDISPAAIRSVAAAIMRSKSPGGRDAGDLDPQVGMRIEQRQRIVP